MDKILVIGGAGYIGSHQVKLLIEENYEVVVVDNLSTGFFDAVNENALFIQGDIRDKEFLRTVFLEHKIGVVMHFAALSIVSHSIDLPLEYYDNNVYGMQVLLSVMHEFKVEKIVFSSTAAVYGIHDVALISEDLEKNPVSPYGETKLAMEKMVEWCAKAYGIKYVVLRYFNVAGAALDGSIGERHECETHLIPIVLEVLLNKREVVQIYGNDYQTPDGTCIRDYIHVLDLCNAHILAMHYLNKGNENKIINLGYQKGYSVQEIIDCCSLIAQKKIPVVYQKRREGDPAILVASNSLAKDVLGWLPLYDDINVIIESAYHFYLKRMNL